MYFFLHYLGRLKFSESAWGAGGKHLRAVMDCSENLHGMHDTPEDLKKASRASLKTGNRKIKGSIN